MRLVKVMSKVVGKSHAFMEGGQIMDAVLVAKEVVDEQLYRKRDRVGCYIS